MHWVNVVNIIDKHFTKKYLQTAEQKSELCHDYQNV